ncbi:MAG: radical SAM family heme chaperone HemW [Saprospiraceae bacterium]|nr:radical SAM family heme chaperone HemW [Saprospiraceae bacterium]
MISFSGGLYLHIPFCKQACHYCNFHFATSLVYKEKLVKALIKEIEITAKKFSNPELKTIYFGGGSPSLLTLDELALILDKICQQFNVDGVEEVTLEANPDDLTRDYLKGLKALGIQRLSIGIQSFHEEDLKWMNRAHDSHQAMYCVPLAQDIGFDALSIDLIFGYPLLTDEKYIYNLNKVNKWQVPHISAYSLTVEEKTPLSKGIKKGLDKLPDEDAALRQFTMTHEILEDYGYEHYEISNYSKPGMHAIHNSNYWLGVPYIGIGPAAHSYYSGKRRWNIANNQQYIRKIESGEDPSESEIITSQITYDELILTRLRTKWGVNLSDIETIGAKYSAHFREKVQELIRKGIVQKSDENYKLTFKGMLMADHWTAELFY